MRIAGKDGAHLFCCLNAWPSADMPGLERAIYTGAARAWELSELPGQKALGLWLNAELAADFAAAEFGRKLADSGLYCVSFNAFPYGVFHGRRVKENVYRPHWGEDARLRYTRNIADILSVLLPEGETGSISTLPLCYRAEAGAETLTAARENLREMARYLTALEARTGREIVLALEPEPDCFLDSSAEAARWLEEQLLDGPEEDMLRRHIGVCFDTVHALVLFEEPGQALAEFTRRGIRVPKIQIGAALGCAGDARERLSPFAEEVYLHQTRVRGGGKISSYPDLPQALAERCADGPDTEWRVHFHVPLSWQGGDGLECVSEGIDREFFAEAYHSGTRHFEIEVYTLRVLPQRDATPEEIFAVELQTVSELLA